MLSRIPATVTSDLSPYISQLSYYDVLDETFNLTQSVLFFVQFFQVKLNLLTRHSHVSFHQPLLVGIKGEGLSHLHCLREHDYTCKRGREVCDGFNDIPAEENVCAAPDKSGVSCNQTQASTHTELCLLLTNP